MSVTEWNGVGNGMKCRETRYALDQLVPGQRYINKGEPTEFLMLAYLFPYLFVSE